MSNPPALPAPGGNATAALALANTSQPEEMVIHSGAATTTEGDMSYLDEEFDPCRQDPRRNMPGVLDSNVEISQLNTSTLTLLISVPPIWQWYNRVLIRTWQTNLWLLNSRHCRVRQTCATLRSWNVNAWSL